MPVTLKNVEDVFSYHAPTAKQKAAYETLRHEALEFAKTILVTVPDCADRQAALRLLREAVMTANAAIALKGAI